MKILKQFGIILGVSFLGELLHEWIPLTIPASIYGLVILFFLLWSGILKSGSVREVGYFLIEIMPLMFIPAAVGLMNIWEELSSMLVPFVVITVVSTFLVMAVSGRTTQKVIELKKRKGQ